MAGCWWGVVVLTICVCYGVQEASGSSEVEAHSVKKNETQRYPLFVFNFHHVEVPYVICLWILLASIAKIGEF